MDNPKFETDYDYEEYETYRDPQVTSVGLPPGQLALIIGVNAVISLIISVAVVLIANRQVFPGDIATPSAREATATFEAGATVGLADTAAVTETAELTPTSAAPLESVTYVVQAGDTLTSIADRFSVSLFDLMLANGLTNQDFIQINQELVIPLGGLPTATATFTPVPIPTETPLPFDPPTPLPEGASVPREPAATVGPSPTPSPTPVVTSTVGGPTPTFIPTPTQPPLGELNIVITEASGVGELFQETVVILNQGAAGVSLNGWKLQGSSLGVFIFPDIVLFSGGSIRVHTAAGQNTPSDLYLNQGEPAWPPGSTVILEDAEGNEISRLAVPAGP